jgi:hypothetical protein
MDAFRMIPVGIHTDLEPGQTSRFGAGLLGDLRQSLNDRSTYLHSMVDKSPVRVV